MGDLTSKKGKQASTLKGYDNVFAQNLRKLMEREKITQGQLANDAGCTRQAISQYMDGTTVPNVDKLLKIADRFEVSIDFLLGRDEKPNDKEQMHLICDYTGLSEKAVDNLHSFKTGFSFIDFEERWRDISFKDGFDGKDMIDAKKQSKVFDKTDLVNFFFGDASKNNNKKFFELFAQSVHDYHVAIMSNIELMEQYLPEIKKRVQQLKDDKRMISLTPEDEKGIVINKLDKPMRYSHYDLQDLATNFINDYFKEEIEEYNKLSAEYYPLHKEMMDLQSANRKGGKHGDNQETE